MLRKAIPGLLLLWCTLSFATEIRQSLDGWDGRLTSARGPHNWRFGNVQLVRLTACLDDVRRHVPPGSVIAFASTSRQEEVERNPFFRSRWVAFLLPEHEVFSIEDPSARHAAEYVIDYRAGLDLPRLELAAQLRGCRLFKVRPQ